MSEALVILSTTLQATGGRFSELVARGDIRVTPIGLYFRKQVDDETLFGITQELIEVHQPISEAMEGYQWALGDVLFSTETRLGEMFSQLDVPEEKQGYIKNVKWVAGRIPKDIRRPPHEVSWRKHYIVANAKTFEDRKEALSLAHDMTQKQLQEFVAIRNAAFKDPKRGEPATPESQEEPDEMGLQFFCTPSIMADAQALTDRFNKDHHTGYNVHEFIALLVEREKEREEDLSVAVEAAMANQGPDPRLKDLAELAAGCADHKANRYKTEPKNGCPRCLKLWELASYLRKSGVLKSEQAVTLV